MNTRLAVHLRSAFAGAPCWGALALLAALLAPITASAAPAPWYYWRSTIDGARVCAQTTPGPGWLRDSAPHDGPGCQARRKVLIIPMR